MTAGLAFGDCGQYPIDRKNVRAIYGIRLWTGIRLLSRVLEYRIPLCLSMPPHDRQLAQHQLRSVLQRLSQMNGPDVLTPRQVCNGTRQFEDAMIRPRR